ncbi:hypothetical protein LTR85_005952 [Meristemomyces frigidus]|nr:hypothetical protein LTR85_005952 [Meristemomyces frigidus]
MTSQLPKQARRRQPLCLVCLWTSLIQDYEKWRLNPKVDQREAADTQRDAPHIRFECYPVELLTSSELARATGVVTGHVPAHQLSNKTDGELSVFIEAARNREDMILVVGRGGVAVRDKESSTALVAALLSIGNTVVIMVDGRTAEQNARLILPLDIVIHHGGTGTVVTALESAVPQIIIPHQCPDQLLQGTKIASIGCGIVLCPRMNLEGANEDVNEAVVAVLEGYDSFKMKCTEWQARLNADEADGLVATQDALFRLIVDAVLMKDRGVSRGWS